MKTNRFFAHSSHALLLATLVGSASAETGPQPDAYVDDAAITAEAKTQIHREPSLKSGNIDIETTQGVVRLSGSVDSADKAVTAGQMAGSVEGVVSVSNDLQVK